MQVEVDDATRYRVVRAVTEVFTGGDINVLIGSTALLGEGWDAPATNTLVLASSIGSYMSSNQMRGRAIRCHAADPLKHLQIVSVMDTNVFEMRKWHRNGGHLTHCADIRFQF